MKITEQMIRKAVDSTTFSGATGEMLPEQQDKYVEMLRDNSRLMKYVDWNNKVKVKGEIDRLHIGEPITRGAPENTDIGETVTVLPTQIDYATKKLRSSLNITIESLDSNIEQENLEETIQGMMVRQTAIDIENAAINGDETITGTTPVDLLLKTNNGWNKLADAAHVIDAAGAYLSDDLLAEAFRRMPDHNMQDPDVKWIMSRRLMVDLAQARSVRLTAGGDRALSLAIDDPLGIPFVDPKGIPLIKGNQSLSILGATYAQGVGDRHGPFKIETGVNDTFIFAIDGGADITVTLPEAILETRQVAALLNAGAGFLLAKDNGQHKLVLTNATSGAGTSIAVKAGLANATLGFTNATTYSGSAAGAAGTIYEGTSFYLTNPKNLGYVFHKGSRIFAEYNKDYDRIEIVIYNRVDYFIHNPDALVKVKNVRVRMS